MIDERWRREHQQRGSIGLPGHWLQRRAIVFALWFGLLAVLSAGSPRQDVGTVVHAAIVLTVLWVLLSSKLRRYWMRAYLTCPCGHELEARSDGVLFKRAREHMDSAHHDRGVTDEQLWAVIRSRIVGCACGQILQGADAHECLTRVKQHFGEAHPEMQLPSDGQILSVIAKANATGRCAVLSLRPKIVT